VKKYLLPRFLEKHCSEEKYKKWLDRKARAIKKRDEKRYNKKISLSFYKEKIHEAIEQSNGKDFYTKEDLDWSLIQKWDNQKAKDGKHNYKKKFYYLPTVDHFDPKKFSYKNPDFKICSWIVNDVKNDLSYDELIQICKKIIDEKI
jgi:hypothetical protein